MPFDVTTTPIQSLALMNNSFVLRMAEQFAERVAAESTSVIQAQARQVYADAFGRRARPTELDEATQFVEQHGLAAFCRVVFNSNEFVYVD